MAEDRNLILAFESSCDETSVAVIENGKVTYTYCYGDRRAGGEPVTVDTGFQVGSIGKLVANIGLMQLVEQGKASLESELGDLLERPR